jgi:hypothetical protein
MAERASNVVNIIEHIERRSVAAPTPPSYGSSRMDPFHVVKAIVATAARTAGFSVAFVSEDGRAFTIAGPESRVDVGFAAADAAIESIIEALPDFDFLGGHYTIDAPGCGGSRLPILPV